MVIRCWMKAFSTRPTESGRTRLVIGETEGISLKGRGCEIVTGMKGWRPSACPLGSKPVRASLRAKSMPDIGSIGLSLARFLGAFAPGRLGSFPRDEAPRPTGRTETAPDRPRLQTAPALHLPHETGGPRNDAKEDRPTTRG